MRDFLHHLFLPRVSNNHRAKVLHIQSLFTLLSMLLVINFFTPKIEQRFPGVLGITANVSIDELVNLTNQKRAEAGLAPLSLNNELSNAAGQKAQHMFANNYWAHTAPDGTTPWVFIKTAGYDYLYAGENLARGFTTAPDAVNAWMASEGHKANILSGNYSEIGFAVLTGNLTGDETVLIVQMFGSRSAAPQAVGSSQDQLAAAPTAVPTIAPAPTSAPVPTRIPTLLPTNTLVPTAIPTLTPTPFAIAQNAPQQPQEQSFIASLNTNPLIDRNDMSKMIAIGITSLFLIVFVIDMIIIERKQIVRLVSHNVDHILFLGIMLLTIALLGKGAIL